MASARALRRRRIGWFITLFFVAVFSLFAAIVGLLAAARGLTEIRVEVLAIFVLLPTFILLLEWSQNRLPRNWIPARFTISRDGVFIEYEGGRSIFGPWSAPGTVLSLFRTRDIGELSEGLWFQVGRTGWLRVGAAEYRNLEAGALAQGLRRSDWYSPTSSGWLRGRVTFTGPANPVLQ